VTQATKPNLQGLL